MTDFLKAIPQGEMKRWYQEFGDLETLNYHLKHAKEDGWHFDPESGLFLREVLPEDVQRAINRTVVDVWFTRPVDLHYHEDVEEILIVSDGTGVYNEKIGASWVREQYLFKERGPVFVPAGLPHTFAPIKDHKLVMRIATNHGILNPQEEIQVVPFYEQWPEGYPE